MDLDTLRSLISAGDTFEYLFFWGHRQKRPRVIDASCLSQWFGTSFEIDGVSYPTAEHWMMAGKARLFGDDEALGRILAVDDPSAVKAIGRQVRGFDHDRWVAHRYGVVVEGNAAKFTQNPALRAYLLGTGSKVLVEASPMDRIWGIGLARDHESAGKPHEWAGLNLLGFALMDVRQTLIENQNGSNAD